MNRFALALLILAAPAAALADNPPAAPAPSPAQAAAPRPPAEISIEITNTNAKVPGFTGSISLSFGDCGSVEAGTGDAHYDLKVCYEDRAGAPDRLGLDVERNVKVGTSVLREKLATSTRIARGTRVIVGRFGTGGDMTEVATTVK